MTKIRTLCVFVFVAVAAVAQSTPTSLQSLIAEARQNNLAIKAAESVIQTTRYMPQQASALPDTEVMVQHFTVGSPRPFAGYSNSDFAYIGFGASQELPYPGKRALRAKVAQHESQFQARRRTLSFGMCSTGLSSPISSLRHRKTSFRSLQRISKSQIRSSKAPRLATVWEKGCSRTYFGPNSNAPSC